MKGGTGEGTVMGPPRTETRGLNSAVPAAGNGVGCKQSLVSAGRDYRAAGEGAC